MHEQSIAEEEAAKDSEFSSSSSESGEETPKGRVRIEHVLQYLSEELDSQRTSLNGVTFLHKSDNQR